MVKNSSLKAAEYVISISARTPESRSCISSHSHKHFLPVPLARGASGAQAQAKEPKPKRASEMNRGSFLAPSE